MQKKPSKNNFRLRLFGALTMLFTILALIISCLFFQSTYKNARENEITNSQIVLERISTQIVSLYEEMDIAATSLTKNSSMKELVLNLNAAGPDEIHTVMVQTKPKLQALLTNMMFSPIISNVLLYDRQNDYFYYTGLYHGNKSHIQSVLTYSNEADLIQKNSDSRLYLGPHRSPWLTQEKIVLSVIRSFSDNATTENTLIEIQVPYAHLDKICRQESFETEKEILLFDEKGTLVYPFDGAVNVLDENIYQTITKNLKEGVTESFAKDYAFYSRDLLDGRFRAVLLSDNSSMKAYTGTILFNSSLTFLVLLISTLLAVFSIISIVSKPLQELIHYINQISLEEDSRLDLPANTLNEFEIINSSFQQMLEKMRESVRQTYEAKIRETNASLTALQAQINPHFMYNALNSISAASEVYGSKMTSRMCRDFSSMLRYTTNSKKQVKLIEEIEHTRNYMNFMKISYDGNFNYEIEIPLNLYNIVLPRLVIQPLVENSFKHGFPDTAPPWHISILCYTEGDKWVISITDNGCGFSDKALEDFERHKKRCSAENTLHLYEELEIEGLGLKNILGRLQLFFGTEIEMTADNLREKETGGRICIKGGFKDYENCNCRRPAPHIKGSVPENKKNRQ